MEEEIPHQIDDVVVVARRQVNGTSYVMFYVRLNGGERLWPYTDLAGATISSDVTITFEPSPDLPNVVFADTAVPAGQLIQLLNWFYLALHGNLGPLNPRQQATVNHYRAAFEYLTSNGLTLRFESGLANSEVAMGVSVVPGSNGQPRIHPGNVIRIIVNPALFTGAHAFSGRQIRLVMFHELLHLSPTFHVAAEQRFQSERRGRSWEVWHQEFYNEAAGDMSRLVGQVPGATPAPERSIIQGGDGGQYLESFNPAGSRVLGGNGDDHIRVRGEWNSVDGMEGNNTYYLGPQTGILSIAASVPGSQNTLVIDPPYTLNHIRVEYFNTWIFVGINPDNSNRTGAELDNVGIIYAYSLGAPSVHSVQVGGQTLSIDAIRAMANAGPGFIGPRRFVLEAPFLGGVIGAIPVVDPDPDPLTVSVLSVEGWGANKSWTIVNGQLQTNTRWTVNSFAETEVTLRVSDGKTWDDVVFLVRWRPDPDSGVIEP